ncbi:conserved hypothetical protein [Thermoanaerobacter italicus Ab9]|uniref:Uncharacterized protein n=1 Tax=Thermoanaerobacter italicus (strain DSM 9252 / Ab9) TaxID=580331 RepID=D3T391_THEIA|nr:hypothetical protein [Thermoanaerobacter italicus]ADD02693.1 conserved hypothetical protein [Thermoanaerobacter italicus Ab9]
MTGIDNNFIVFYQKQNPVTEILDLTNSTEDVICEVVKIDGKNLMLKMGSKIIFATNNSSFSFKQGDKVLLTQPKYQDGKLIFKVAHFFLNKNAVITNFNTRDILLDKNPVKLLLSKTRSNNLNLSTNIVEAEKEQYVTFIEAKKIPQPLLKFVKGVGVFIGTLETDGETFLIKVGDTFFEIDGELLDLPQKGEFASKDIMSLKSNDFLFIFNQEKGLFIIPKERILKEDFNSFILNILSNTSIRPKDEEDVLAILSLVLAKKPLTKEEFFKEKVQIHKFIEKLVDFYKEELQPTKEDVFLLFKVLQQSRVTKSKIAQILNTVRFNDKSHIKFDFGSFYLNIFNLKLDVNNNSFEIQFFVNRKKGLDFKVNSIMIRLNTQNLGCVGVYVKRVYSNKFEAIFISDRLSTLKLVNDKEKILIESLKAKGYSLELDYRMEKTSARSAIMDFLILETGLQKIDIRV